MCHVLLSIKSFQWGEEGEEHASKFSSFLKDIRTFGILNNNTLKPNLDTYINNKQKQKHKHLHVNYNIKLYQLSKQNPENLEEE